MNAELQNTHWSYSKLSTFSDCPYKFYLKYIAKVKDHEMFFASYGTFIHSLLERYYSDQLKAGELFSEYLLGFSDNVRGERPSEKIAASYFNDGADYFRDFKPLDIETIATEKEIHFHIGGCDFTAILDMVGRSKDGLVIVDNKSRRLKPYSGRRKPTQNDMELDKMFRQLYIYSEALKQECGDYPTTLCFNCFRAGCVIKQEFDWQKLDETLQWALKMVEIIQNCEDFYPKPDYFSCRYICGVNHECIYKDINDESDQNRRL